NGFKDVFYIFSLFTISMDIGHQCLGKNSHFNKMVPGKMFLQKEFEVKNEKITMCIRAMCPGINCFAGNDHDGSVRNPYFDFANGPFALSIRNIDNDKP